MSETKHTPGPWHRANGQFGPSVCGPIQAGLTGGTTAPCVAVVHGRGDEAEREANARLIAAAPLLAEAARALVAWDNSVLAERPTSLLAVVEQARAALRKAGVE